MGKVEQDKIPAAAPTEAELEIARLRAQVAELQSKHTTSMIAAAPGLDLEARSVGKADVNATTSGADRNPDGNHLPKSEGPRIGLKREFLPAEYPIESTVVNAAGVAVTFSQSRRDR